MLTAIVFATIFMLALVGLGALVVRLWRGRPWRALRRQERQRMDELDKGGWDRGLRQKAKKSADWAQVKTETVKRNKDRERAEFLHDYERWYGTPPDSSVPVPTDSDIVAARWLTIGGLSSLNLEVVVGAFTMTLYTMLPATWAALVGAVFAIFIAGGAKGTTSAYIARHRDQPIHARDTLIRLLIGLSATIALLLVVVLLARNVEWAPLLWLSGLFGPGLAILAVLLPIASGICLALAQLLRWSARRSRAFEAWSEVEGDLQLLAREAERILRNREITPSSRDGNSPDDSPEQTTVPPDADWARAWPQVILLIPLSLGLLLSSLPTDAQTLGETTIAWDVTASVDSVGESGIRKALLYELRELGETGALSGVHVVRFTDDGFSRLPELDIRWPQVSVLCQRPKQDGEMLRRRWEQRVRDAQAHCDERRQAARRRYDLAVDSIIGKIDSLFLSPVSRRGQCTAVWDALRRATRMRRSSLLIVVTDGVESCEEGTPRIPEPDGVRVIVILRPRIAEDGTRASSFEQRRSSLVEVAPWAEVLVPWEIEHIS